MAKINFKWQIYLLQHFNRLKHEQTFCWFFLLFQESRQVQKIDFLTILSTQCRKQTVKNYFDKIINAEKSTILGMNVCLMKKYRRGWLACITRYVSTDIVKLCLQLTKNKPHSGLVGLSWVL